jgi:carboxymethylenebutenolidase
MIEQHLDIPTAHGMMNTFITHPEEGGPHPVVFFYMDAPGKREELHDMARRLGTAGYYVILPNLYYRWHRDFNVFSGDPSQTRDAMFELMQGLSDYMVTSDTNALFAHVDHDPAADATRVGCMGYRLLSLWPGPSPSESRPPRRSMVCASLVKSRPPTSPLT